MTQTEKPYHYTYLKGFRVEQCAQFLQHKCTNHKPFTCFDWHFMNQRRRRPVKKADGNFNYSPDTYCTKYDETTGICPDKDECPFLHRTAGDTERRYHLRYYKTGICVHDTDARGHCVKNGQHCAFAHGAHDLRNPVYDLRELQAAEQQGGTVQSQQNANSGNSLGNGSGGQEISDQQQGATGAAALLLSSGPNSLDRERNALNEDPRWNETAYVLANYKTDICKRPPRLCRQGYACPQYHNSKDRRRTPKTYKYRSTPCPSVKQGDEWGDPVNCEQGENCPYCHTRTEQQFHPEIYKSTKCNDMQQSGYCPRGPFCAFAHDEKEITATRDINLDLIDTEPTPLKQQAQQLQSLQQNLHVQNLQQNLQQAQQQMSQLFDQEQQQLLIDSLAIESRNVSISLSSMLDENSQNSALTSNLGNSSVVGSGTGPGPIARPRSLSQSQAKIGANSAGSDSYNLHAALAAVRFASMREDPLLSSAAEQAVAAACAQSSSAAASAAASASSSPFGIDLWKRAESEAAAAIANDRRPILSASLENSTLSSAARTSIARDSLNRSTDHLATADFKSNGSPFSSSGGGQTSGSSSNTATGSGLSLNAIQQSFADKKQQDQSDQSQLNLNESHSLGVGGDVPGSNSSTTTSNDHNSQSLNHHLQNAIHQLNSSNVNLNSSLHHAPGPIARPRSYSQSQAKVTGAGTNLDNNSSIDSYNLHAALAAVRLSMRDDPSLVASTAEHSPPSTGNTPTPPNPSPFDLWKRDPEALERRVKLAERQRDEALTMATALRTELKAVANGGSPYLHAIHSFGELDNVPVNQLLQLRQQLSMDLELLDKLIQRKDHDCAWP